jgi:hypothetical protein
MVSSVMPCDQEPDQTDAPRPNVEPDQLHLVVTLTELNDVVDALLSVGNNKLAERFEAVLGHLGGRPSR